MDNNYDVTIPGEGKEQNYLELENVGGREAVENSEDEVSILADKDGTLEHDLSGESETSDRGARGQFIDEEPEAFVRGDVDVKTQMDRVTRAVEVDLGGFSERSRNEDPRIPNS